MADKFPQQMEFNFNQDEILTLDDSDRAFLRACGIQIPDAYWELSDDDCDWEILKNISSDDCLFVVPRRSLKTKGEQS